MRFLPVSIAMLVEHSVNIHQVVGHKIKGCHILIFMGFAMPVHFGQIYTK
jgi:hypothetical protein